ncbi:RagB/SusD family nutrient uptake outer membrane protein [Halosquirtibacter laminarini]|uniref:RagB/SusD family nutrient uptake outer membrane protein n=1 Tax=Halosquirtibacter laminarini TaxID=3374600 RepID=A0AC61NM88_9BACT|nr:RagB/SusD family nutrient uptake outer membrane protein [Prolixibacteraceae bacterium]
MKYIYIVLLFLFLSSCNSLLEENPESFINPDTYFNNAEQALTSVNGVYAAMLNRSNSPFMDLHLKKDIGTSVSAARSNNETLNIYSFTSSARDIKEIYRGYYLAIERANCTINRISKMDPEVTHIKEPLQNRLLSEAKFIRAYSYFGLVRLYGAVPLNVTEVRYDDNFQMSRNSVAEVYKQIIEDLEFASEWLYFKTGSSLSPSYGVDDVGRVSRCAANGLLAKVYLTAASMKRHSHMSEAWNLTMNSYDWVDELLYYQKAKEYGEKVVGFAHDGANVGLEDDVVAPFYYSNENNKESLFELQLIEETGYKGLSAGSMSGIFGNSSKPTSGKYRITLANGFIESFIQNYTSDDLDYTNSDPRMVAFLNVYLWKGKNPKYINLIEPNKFSFVKYKTTARCFFEHDQNQVLLRYADILLVLAEANNELGDQASAAKYVNIIRARARRGSTISKDMDAPIGVNYPESSQPEDVLTSLTQEEMLEVVYQERKWELCYEGQTRFDAVRMGRLVSEIKAQHLYKKPSKKSAKFTYFQQRAQGISAVFDPKKITPGAENIRQHHILFPIPMDELNRNIGIVSQNVGY